HRPLATEVVEHADVGMIESRNHAGLAFETRSSLRVLGQLRSQDLDRDVAPQSHVLRAIHFPHASRAERGDDLEWAKRTPNGKWHPDSLPHRRSPRGVVARCPARAGATPLDLLRRAQSNCGGRGSTPAMQQPRRPRRTEQMEGSMNCFPRMLRFVTALF